ncbi:MAG TPA: hypothetical protein VNO21_21880, partial [Polyangiaceae bacterium]|nr:hypothetical protein [Polyangiaceae bacterium]
MDIRVQYALLGSTLAVFAGFGCADGKGTRDLSQGTSTLTSAESSVVSAARGGSAPPSAAPTPAATTKGVDPGPRAGAAGAGGPFPGLNTIEQGIFTQATDVFAEVDSVSGTIAGEDGRGLGPRFN